MVAAGPRLLFYGGKGGVGKTTCAAARAVIEAQAGARVLVVSTDPAHSLGDALAVRLSYSPRLIPGVAGRAVTRRAGQPKRRCGTLHGVELNARRAFGRWLARRREALADVLERGTWLDREDIDALLDLPLPGVDELVGLLEIARLARIAPPSESGGDLHDSSPEAAPRSGPHYDIVVVDTAPTGHTLRLLASPEAVAAVSDVLDELQEEHRIVRARFAGAVRPDAADRLIAVLAGQARKIAGVLRDASRTTFHWVTLPEALSLAETGDAIAVLENGRMPVAEIVVNRVLPDDGPCPVCDARRTAERRVVADLLRQSGQQRRVRLVRAELCEPRGIAALAGIGRAMAEGLVRPTAPIRHRRPGSRPAVRPPKMALSIPQHERAAAVESLASFRDASLLFVAGKGGVGKTTVAAAAALRLARSHPERRILLLSTDPAHSLGDVLDLPAGSIGDEAMPLLRGPSNLAVRELDAVQALARRRALLERALDDLASSLGAAAPRDRGAGMMQLAPPGIDELFGILSVVEARGKFPHTIIDMAPTGHALRLLEQPDATREWVQALLHVLMKYRSIARPGRLARELVTLSRSIRDLQRLLRDASRTHVVVVTRAADLPRLETDRFLVDLRRLEMAVPAVLVNALTLGPGPCSRCGAIAAEERRQIATLQRRRHMRSLRCAIIQTPLAAPPPRGIAALEAWAAHWTSSAPATQNRRRPGSAPVTMKRAR